MLPVLDVFLTEAPLSQDRQVQPEIVALFRNMWYLCVLSGFLSTATALADWQRAILVRIAVNTPGLLEGAGDDFVETGLQFNPVLRRKVNALVRVLFSALSMCALMTDIILRFSSESRCDQG